MNRHFKYLIHNCIIHPLLPFLPKSWAESLHDINAEWAFNDSNYDASTIQMDALIFNYAGKSTQKLETSQYTLHTFNSRTGARWLVVLKPGAIVHVKGSMSPKKFKPYFDESSIGLALSNATQKGWLDFLVQENNVEKLNDTNSEIDRIYHATLKNCTSGNRSFEIRV